MKITVSYMAHLKQATGVSREELTLPDTCTGHELVHRLSARHGESLRRLLLTDAGALQPTILLFVNDSQVPPGQEMLLHDGDDVTLLAPIAGGAAGA